MDNVPRLSRGSGPPSDLDEVVSEHDFIMLSINMKGLPDFLSHLKPRIREEKGQDLHHLPHLRASPPGAGRTSSSLPRR